jgi:ABC-type lipoprotein export system ATPase subunit
VPSDAQAASSERGVLTLERVSRTYRRGQEEVHALADVSVTFRPGEMAVVLGPSGGGKSTLLHLLGGMDRPDSGRVLVGGVDIARLGSDRLTAYRRTEVGFVFQSFHLLSGRTAVENVALPLVMAGVPPAARRARAMALLERVGLADRAEHRPGELSGGQAQRVAIARALAADPPLILADEPTGNLDSHSGEEVMALLASLARQDGRTVVVVTHNQEFAAMADRVLHLRDGRIVSDERRPQDAVPSVAAVGAAPAPPAGRGHVGFGALVGMALSAVLRRVARGVLTGLGVTIGIASMVLLLGLGAGLEQGVTRGLLDFGPLTAVSVSPQSSSGGLVSTGPRTLITPAALARLGRLKGARVAYASVTAIGTVTLNGRTAEAALTALPPTSAWAVRGLLPDVSYGHLPRRPGQVALSARTARLLLNRPHGTLKGAIGLRVKVAPEELTGSLFGGGGAAPPASAPRAVEATVTAVTGGPNVSYVAYAQGTAWVRQAAGTGAVTYPGATVIATSSGGVNALSKRISALGYGVTTLSSILKSVQSVFSVIETGLGAVGGIALVVAGLMIGVVMSMSVLERRREIGILRAVGARRRDVSRLFLAEAGVIGLAGGVVGVGLGFVGATIANAVLSSAASGLGDLVAIPPWLVVLGLCFGAAVAIIAGAIPASHAAGMNPVDALRDA